jgi:hypothetical protein
MAGLGASTYVILDDVVAIKGGVLRCAGVDHALRKFASGGAEGCVGAPRTTAC